MSHVGDKRHPEQSAESPGTVISGAVEVPLNGYPVTTVIYDEADKFLAAARSIELADLQLRSWTIVTRNADEASRKFKRLARLFQPVRCRSCYLPMEHDFMRELFICQFCGHKITDEAFARRPRWKQWLDYIIGVTDTRP